MHYDREAFSKNGQDTIKTRDTRYNHLIGQAMDFSQVDLAKINAMYECGSRLCNRHSHALVQSASRPTRISRRSSRSN